MKALTRFAKSLDESPTPVIYLHPLPLRREMSCPSFGGPPYLTRLPTQDPGVPRQGAGLRCRAGMTAAEEKRKGVLP